MKKLLLRIKMTDPITIVTEDQVLHVRRDRLHNLECAANSFFRGEGQLKPIRDDCQGYASANFFLKDHTRITVRTNGEIVVDSNLKGLDKARGLVKHYTEKGLGYFYVVIRQD